MDGILVLTNCCLPVFLAIQVYQGDSLIFITDAGSCTFVCFQHPQGQHLLYAATIQSGGQSQSIGYQQLNKASTLTAWVTMIFNFVLT